ncbi:hypothetical protein JNUCC0626_48525 [Lentzea sp. JNUCC 0626]|uniref:hypothetical protein n=1 Tax=Lentzea sp. JNUCC 0626 TaxID=3367513 RepID=UPI00374A79DE
MQPHEGPEIEVRTFHDNGCVVTSVVADPADAQQILYGTVARDGVLIGSFYCVDQARQSGWRVVMNGTQYALNGLVADRDLEGDVIGVLTSLPTPL